MLPLPAWCATTKPPSNSPPSARSTFFPVKPRQPTAAPHRPTPTGLCRLHATVLDHTVRPYLTSHPLSAGNTSSSSSIVPVAASTASVACRGSLNFTVNRSAVPSSRSS